MENKYKGWVDGFGYVVSDQLGKDVKYTILDQCTSCQAISSDKEMAICIKQVMKKFDEVVPDKDKRYGVMETMGTYCFSTYFAKTAKDIKKKSNGIEEMIKNLNNLTGGDHFELKGNKIYSNLKQCYCQIGVKERDESISKTYCSCSLGWMKNLFKTLLDKPVKVEMLETIVSGGEACKFIIEI